MLESIQHLGQRAFWQLDRWGNAAFGEKCNPMYHLGTLSFYFFYILFGTGIYLYIYFSPDIQLAYERLEYLTVEQWYIGGVMRSLHRYISDALIVTIVLHVTRGFVMAKYKGFRWYFWITGTLMLWLVFPTGVTGYWLVWDELAQFIAVKTSEWLDFLPLFAEPIARNFLSNEAVSNTFFRLLVVVHFVLPIFMLIAMFTHIYRLKKAKINPPRSLAVGILLAFTVLSLIKPALSQAPANLSIIPATLQLDWFYLFFYPLIDIWSPGAVWGLLLGLTLLFMLIPWLSPHRKELAARVVIDECSGCGICVDDCPYEAIVLQPGIPQQGQGGGTAQTTHQAFVLSDRCSSCGVCVGACPFSSPFRKSEHLSSGIELPALGVSTLRDQIRACADRLSGEATVLAFACKHSVDLQILKGSTIATIKLPCTGMLPASMVDFALKLHIDGVFVTGCRTGDCRNRLGNVWIQQRLDGERDPILHKSVSRHRVECCWAAPTDDKPLADQLHAFQNRLKQMHGNDS
ncbi:MAG: cytochrome b N-terminal domain-containing protein [Mariprofundus sp.]